MESIEKSLEEDVSGVLSVFQGTLIPPFSKVDSKPFYHQAQEKKKGIFNLLMEKLALLEEETDLSHIIISDAREFSNLARFSNFQNYI
jgi:hypothetical protein